MDLSFLEIRGKALEIAAFLDRLDRYEGEEDFRIDALRQALVLLLNKEPGRAKAFLDALSDNSDAPIDLNPGKAACGAPQPA